MKNLLLAVMVLCVCLPVTAERIDPNQIRYEGWFRAPSGSWFTFWRGGLTMANGCLGQPDPSPNDGYPGCMIGVGYKSNDNMLGLFDIVPPTPDGANQATQVGPLWDVTDNVPIDNYPEHYDGQLEGYGDVYLDQENGCTLWWSYLGTYGNDPDWGSPIYARSDCSTTMPQVLTPMWAFSTVNEGTLSRDNDPYHPMVYYQSITHIPTEIASAHFDGKQQWLGPGKSQGSRGSGVGPEGGVRPWTDPPNDVIDDITRVLMYPHGTRPQWHVPTLFRGASDTQASMMSHSTVTEFLSVNGQVAMFTNGERALPDPNRYPFNDPSAIYWNNPLYPSPDEYGVCWYGVTGCNNGAPHQQPSFYDTDANGDDMPVDCNLGPSDCPQGTGPRCNNLRHFAYLYSLDDLAAHYRGEREWWESQPYAEWEISFDFNGDGYTDDDKCMQFELNGSTYDQAAQRLFLSWGGSGTGKIQVYSVGGDTEPPPIELFSDGFETGGLEAWQGEP